VPAALGSDLRARSALILAVSGKSPLSQMELVEAVMRAGNPELDSLYIRKTLASIHRSSMPSSVRDEIEGLLSLILRRSEFPADQEKMIAAFLTSSKSRAENLWEAAFHFAKHARKTEDAIEVTLMVL